MRMRVAQGLRVRRDRLACVLTIAAIADLAGGYVGLHASVPGFYSARPPPLLPDGHGGGACGVTADQPVRIAACFYGLFRAGGRLALPTIEANLLAPLRRAGGVDVIVHAMLATTETSGWDGGVEGMAIDSDEYKRFDPCVANTEGQAAVDREHNLSAIADRMLYDRYQHTTKLNVVRSRYSVWRAAVLVRSREHKTGVPYTHVVLARPDTAFLAPVRWEPLPDAIRVANYEQWWGVCDRFGYGPRHLMLDGMMSQFPFQYSRADFAPGGANSENLMCHHLRSRQVHVAVTPVCLVRVRGTGSLWAPDVEPQVGFPSLSLAVPLASPRPAQPV